ncbi:MAG: type IX secretion system sortase PorU [Cytophagaceae bacterium]
MTKLRIKYLYLLFLFFLCSTWAVGQKTGEVKIHWLEPVKVLGDAGGISMPTFTGAAHIKENEFLPFLQVKVEGYVTDFKIEKTVTEAVSESERKLLQQYKENTYSTRIHLAWENKRPISYIQIVPIRYSQSKGECEKLLSFSYACQLGSPPVVKVERRLNSRVSSANARISGTNVSVLSQGDWYKFQISKSGIYKIDYALLQEIGLNVSNLDPRRIKIYGNGGGMLPQANSAARYDDLVENAIYVEGEGDGVFNQNDFILFYAEGPDTWSYNADEGVFNHTKNIYSDHTFYFLTISPDYGERVNNMPDLGSASQTINRFNERIFHHQDLENLLKSGREWYGEKFDFITQRNFSFSFPGLVGNSQVKIRSAVMSSSIASSRFQLNINGQSLGNHEIDSSIPNRIYGIKGFNSIRYFTINSSAFGNNSNFNISVSYDKRGMGSAVGYLNYLEVNALRDLRLYGNQTAFRSIESLSAPTARYTIAATSGALKIWNITQPLNPRNQVFTYNGSQAVFYAPSTELQEYIVFSGSNFDRPTFVRKVPNQNLHGISQDVPVMVIVANEKFLSQAQKLAHHRRNANGISVEVVTTEQVYNEFSSGAQDISAIRDFMKSLYDGPSGDRLKYLLLFGDCSYDYKNRIASNSNYVPVYQSRQSLHNVDSHSSDDYFGFLDDAEGEWIENSSGDHNLDIGIGRLPVNSAAEAEAVVNKLIHYHNPASMGNWRNRLTFVADDGDRNLHLDHADQLSDFVLSNSQVYNINKIYLDAYPQISSPGGEIAPEVNRAIDQAADKGTLIMNYSGHGGVLGWAQENILDIPMVNRWRNMDNLMFLVTATCDFGRYDDPAVKSGAEHTLVSAQGGSIGILTSTRAVYASTNLAINMAFYKHIFSEVAGGMPLLGYVMKEAKNDSKSGVNNRNYALLGDPSMSLAYPKHDMVITKISNGALESDTLKALSKITLEGEIRNASGAKINDFNGKAHITVFEKKTIVRTFGTEGSQPITFNVQRNFIYDGQATVSNGSFSLSFIVPKDIAYHYGNGKVSMYAQREMAYSDAHGHKSDIIIGGSDPNAAEDTTPPEISLYLNDETFVFGGLTGPDPKLIVKLFDESGINVAGTGVGHEISANLDNKSDVIILNDYYTANLDDYKRGRVEYPFRDLPEGMHSLKLKAWDTHNNPADAYLEFIVAIDSKLALKHVLNYPNPFSTSTTFHFDHNRAGDDLDVLIQVYTVSGKLVRTLEGRCYGCPTHLGDIHWNGRDDFGDKIGKGVYVYKVNVRSLRDGSTNFQYQKLVILN